MSKNSESDRTTEMTSSSDIPADWVDPVLEGSTSTSSKLWGGSEEISTLTCGADEKKLMILSSLRELHSTHETQAFVTAPVHVQEFRGCPVGEWVPLGCAFCVGEEYVGGLYGSEDNMRSE